MKKLDDHVLGARPFKDLLLIAISGSQDTFDELAVAMGFPKPEQMHLYIDGKIKLPLQAVVKFAAKRELDVAYVVRLWMAENYPDLLEFLDTLPAPLLLTMNERRAITHIREFTEGSDAEVVVADGRDVLAVVMV